MLHPDAVLHQEATGGAMAAQPPAPIPACEHFAGDEKKLRKALELQDRLNGTFDVTNSSWTRWPTSFVNVAVGLGYNSRFFQGNIGQVQIYNRALSATEILQNYNATRKRFGL